jgi:hypothetical protein
VDGFVSHVLNGQILEDRVAGPIQHHSLLSVADSESVEDPKCGVLEVQNIPVTFVSAIQDAAARAAECDGQRCAASPGRDEISGLDGGGEMDDHSRLRVVYVFE